MVHQTYDSRWNSYINIRRSRHIKAKELLDDVNFCCPSVIENKIAPDFEIVNSITRLNCNITQSEFEEKFVRTQTPVILQHCEGYEWVKKYDFESVSKVYYDNSTKCDEKFSTPPPPLGFTHSETPNDFSRSIDESIERMAKGILRSFEIIRNHPRTDPFSAFNKPAMIPNDLFNATGYENHYNWVILSQAKTGSYIHVDPDITGAWNYLISGYKHWVIFPPCKYSFQML